MSYAGLADPKKRADIIDYLHTLSHSPEALPPPPPAGAAPAAAPAAPGAPAAAPPPPQATPIADRLGSADPAVGQAATMKLGCVACHTFNEGGRAGLGAEPLWGRWRAARAYAGVRVLRGT